MSYSSGSGTAIDPYMISTADDWSYFWSAVGMGYSTPDTYFKLQNDIDCGGLTAVLGGPYFRCVLDGDYHTVSNFTFSGDKLVSSNYILGTLKNIHIDANFLQYGWLSSGYGAINIIDNVKFTVRSGRVFRSQSSFIGNSGKNNKKRIVFDLSSSSLFYDTSSASAFDMDPSVYVLSPLILEQGLKYGTSLVGSDRYIASLYPLLDWDHWELVGLQTPRLVSSPPQPAPNASDVAKNLHAIGFYWANTITKTQAWPGDLHFASLDYDALNVCAITRPSHLLAPPLSVEYGYITGVITRKGIPVSGKHVVCLDDKFNIVADTLSGIGGIYRFDNLMRSCLYTIIAQDNFDFKYAPVGADRRTPEAYV